MHFFLTWSVLVCLSGPVGSTRGACLRLLHGQSSQVKSSTGGSSQPPRSKPLRGLNRAIVAL